MIWIALFLVVLFSATLYAGWRGGAPERWVAGIFFTAAAVSLVQPQAPGAYQHVFWSIAAIDTLVFLALTAIALIADRFWPLSLAGLQLINVALHGVRAYNPHLLPYAYWLLVGKISYLMLILLVIGTARHWRRLQEGQLEYDWTACRHAQQGEA